MMEIDKKPLLKAKARSTPFVPQSWGMFKFGSTPNPGKEGSPHALSRRLHRTRNSLRKGLWPLIAFMVVAMVASCGGNGGNTPSPTALPELSPEEVIAKASPLLDTLESFHFELEQQGGGTPIDMGIEMTAASGDVIPPDRLRMDITGTWGRMFLSTQLITVGEETYMQNPLNQKWEPTKFAAITLFQPDTGINAIMQSVTDLAMLPGETVEGAPCFHLSGMLRSEVLDSVAVGHAAEGLPVETEIWIGAEDFLLRRVTFKGQITEEEVPGIVRTLTLSRFNEPVTIELP